MAALAFLKVIGLLVMLVVYAWLMDNPLEWGLSVLIAVGLWLRSAWYLLWVVTLVTPAWLTFLKVFEERELEIRFGAAYLDYKGRTPMLLPGKPRV